MKRRHFSTTNTREAVCGKKATGDLAFNATLDPYDGITCKSCLGTIALWEAEKSLTDHRSMEHLPEEP